MRKRQVFAAVAVALTLAGCGARPESSSTTNDPTTNDSNVFGNAQELVRAATDQTAKAKSAKFTAESSLAGQAVTAQGQARFDGADTVMDMTMTVGPVREEMRYVDRALYVQLPEQYRARMTSGKPWGKVPADSAVAKQIGAQQAQQNDPSQALQQIQQAGTITRSAHETLDGQPVTHYWIDVDFAKGFDKFKNTGLPEAQLNEIAAKVKTIPVELWLGSDKLPVQITEDMSALMKAAGAPATAQDMKITMKYSDWGTPVDVQAPPANQVGELKLPSN
ncbi:hypothetical protein [Amycolatopsis pithecellobii]|nr:hypothetical protein [Amycolatopsis pithecellobii]